ncbi:MAG TPA: methyltransferase domain-containing protein [Mycobacteriales bacterium]|nr:methyltransferase domain-containing protein [Mycobacteriales bacterium]
MLDSAIGDGVSRALSEVPREHYAGGVSGSDRVPPTTPPGAVERDLVRAGIGPGMRVLEIGTGTGYTGAVLAVLVGPDGLVASVDIAAGLVERAAALHAERGVSNVVLRAADGHLGIPEHGPYDAVVAWASPLEIPAAWVRQCRAGAVICSPVYLAPVAGAVGHLHAAVDGGRLVEPRLATASYADMGTDVTGFDPDLPAHHVDARETLAGGRVAWISTAWRGQYPGHEPVAALRMLCDPRYTEPVPLAESGEGRVSAWQDFRSYCTGRDPSNLTSFGVSGVSVEGPGSGAAIGFSSGLNAAALTDAGELVANGPDSPALTKVRDYFTEWDRSGRPGVDTLRPVLRPTSTGWQVRTTPTRLARRRPASGGGES